MHNEENEEQVPMEEIKKKAPGGKTIPSLIATTQERANESNLVISISRNSLEPNEATDSSPTSHTGLPKTNGSNCRIRRSELQLLVDTNTNSSTSSSRLPRSVENETHSRKRAHPDTSPPLNPYKKHCTSLENYTPTPTTEAHSPLNCSSLQKDDEESEKYYAELVAFDSRKECLLVDGEYQLHLTKLAPRNKVPTELRMNGMKPSTLFKWGSGIDPCNKAYTVECTVCVASKFKVYM